jgi:hypothetical protein
MAFSAHLEVKVLLLLCFLRREPSLLEYYVCGAWLPKRYDLNQAHAARSAFKKYRELILFERKAIALY